MHIYITPFALADVLSDVLSRTVDHTDGTGMRLGNVEHLRSLRKKNVNINH